MGNQMKSWQLVLLVLLLPPVGVCIVCSRPDIRIWIKALAVMYFVCIILTVLTLRLPVGDVTISAEKLG